MTERLALAILCVFMDQPIKKNSIKTVQLSAYTNFPANYKLRKKKHLVVFLQNWLADTTDLFNLSKVKIQNLHRKNLLLKGTSVVLFANLVRQLSLLWKNVAVFRLQNNYEKKAKQFFSTSLLFTKSWNLICVKFVAKLLVCLRQIVTIHFVAVHKKLKSHLCKICCILASLS